MKTDEEILEEKRSKYPNLTQEEVKFINSTPDENYPLRILQTYRRNCDSFWETRGLSEDDTRFWEIMNEHQRERAEILDRAIRKLTKTNN